MNKSVDETDRSSSSGGGDGNVGISGPGTTIESSSTTFTTNLTTTPTTDSTTIFNTNTTIDDNDNFNNSKFNSTTVSHHPLSSYDKNNYNNNNNNNINNNNQHHHDDIDMSEINLSTTTTTPSSSTIQISTTVESVENSENNLNNNDTKKKLNWVKFDDDDRSGNGISSSGDGTAAINKSPNLGPMETTTKLSPPPSTNKLLINAPVSSTQNMKSLPSTSGDVGAAVLTTETVHVNLNQSSTSPQKPNSTIHPNNNNHNINNNINNNNNTNNNNTNSNSNSNTPATLPATSPTTQTTINTTNSTPKSVSISMSTPTPPMRTIELSTGRIREGFANGDVIVTLLPTNTKWPWITPALFRPELVPEELMAQGLTLTVEEYVNAMETLVNDFRFTVYNICYKRVLVCWILFAFCVLLALLFSGLQGIALFSLGVAWLFLNAAAIFLCMWVKLRLSRGLEKCLARVNKQLLRHKILLVLDDRGRISCHKVNLCFMYFDPALCIAYLNEFIERHEQNGTNIQAGWEKKLDLDVNDIVIQGSNPVRLSRKQERSVLLYLRYGSRWGNEIVRGLGDVSVTEPARHCANYICPCQYIERHLACKPRGKFKMFNIIYWVLASERYEN